ncbi:hypothetical protein [Pseudomonas akapageensis]|uniref:hypothetical protein n=1 Tax=Pseudomonas akapageensis TaxID=2609961 RepID=UPI0031B62E95
MLTSVSFIASAEAKEGGGHGGGGAGGNGGGNGGGHGGGAGNGAGHGADHGGGIGGGIGGGAGHKGDKANEGHGKGLSDAHESRSVRDHGVSGHHYGNDRNSDKGRGTTTSAIAHSRDTRGLAKATAIAGSKPGTHNSKGLSHAGVSSSKNDH